MELSRLLVKIKDNPSGHVFTVAPIPNNDNAFLGVDQSGSPWLFLKVNESTHDVPLRTSQITLFPAQEYCLNIAGAGTRTEVLRALKCDANNTADVDNFLVLVEAFLASTRSTKIDDEALSRFFRSMVRLFTVEPARDLKAARQGLWGELFFMRNTKGYKFWAPFWHSETTRMFDFSTSNIRLEIKTTIGNQRVHHFSHRQVFALEGEEIVIASILLQEDDTGLNLKQLIEECRNSLMGTDYYLKLEKAVRRAGMDDISITGPIYDSRQAAESIALFKSTEAPHFKIPEPPGVSDTHYRVDLSTAPRLSPEVIHSWLDVWLTAEGPLKMA